MLRIRSAMAPRVVRRDDSEVCKRPTVRIRVIFHMPYFIWHMKYLNCLSRYLSYIEPYEICKKIQSMKKRTRRRVVRDRSFLVFFLFFVSLCFSFLRGLRLSLPFRSRVVCSSMYGELKR